MAAGLVVVLAVVTGWELPALAHEEDGESDPVNQVEQALAIVVNTPDAIGEAMERVEGALAAEAAEPSGELDITALEEAAAALEGGCWVMVSALVLVGAWTTLTMMVAFSGPAAHLG